MNEIAQILSVLPELGISVHTCVLADTTYFVIGEKQSQKRSAERLNRLAALLVSTIERHNILLLLDQYVADTDMETPVNIDDDSLLLRLRRSNVPRTRFDIRTSVASIFHPSNECAEHLRFIQARCFTILRANSSPSIGYTIVNSHVAVLDTMVVVPASKFLTTYDSADADDIRDATALNIDLKETFEKYIQCVGAYMAAVGKKNANVMVDTMLDAVTTYRRNTGNLADFAKTSEYTHFDTEETRRTALHAATIHAAEQKTYLDTYLVDDTDLDTLEKEGNELVNRMIFTIPADIKQMYLEHLIRSNTAKINIVCSDIPYATNIVSFLRETLHYTVLSAPVTTPPVDYREKTVIARGVRYRLVQYASPTATSAIPAILDHVVKGTSCINITTCIHLYRESTTIMMGLPSSEQRTKLGCVDAVYNSTFVCAVGDIGYDHTVWGVMLVMGGTAYTINTSYKHIAVITEVAQGMVANINYLYSLDTRKEKMITNSRVLTLCCGMEDADPKLIVYQAAAIVSKLIHSESALSILRAHTAEQKVADLEHDLIIALKLSDSDMYNIGALFYTEYIRETGEFNDEDVEQDPPRCTF